MKIKYNLRNPHEIINKIKSGEIKDVSDVINNYNNKLVQLTNKYGYTSQVFNSFKKKCYDIFVTEYKNMCEQ